MAKKGATKSNSKRKNSENITRTIVKNLVELQKIHTDLAEKFDKLTKEISALLSLFEHTAKTFAGSQAIQESEKDKAFLDKIDKLLEQNKTIAKGLTLMESNIRERTHSPSENEEKLSPQGRPLPRF